MSHLRRVGESTGVPGDPGAGRHRLPAPPTPFIGRDGEMRRLLAALPASVVIQGPVPGTGKTGLALSLAAQVRGYYSDAQLYLDLHGSDEAPLGAHAAMARLAQAMLPGATLPHDRRGMLVQYRAMLEGKRGLIVLDDAADAEQVLALLPAPPAVAIVTSRRPLELPGAVSMTLDPLPAADADALLLQLAPRAGPSALRLAELCGGNPLALRATGALLARRAEIDTQDYARRLAAHMPCSGDPAVAIGFADSLLPSALAGRRRTLATLPAPFDAEAAAMLWLMEPAAARDLLEEMARWELVQFDAPGGQWAVHGALRRFADSLPLPERFEARRRHGAYCTLVAAAAEAASMRGAEQVIESMAAFARDWTSLEAAFAFAANAAGRDRLCEWVCCHLPRCAAAWLLMRIPPEQRLTWLEPALAAARRLGDAGAERAHLRALVSTCTALARMEAARQYEAELLGLDADEGQGPPATPWDAALWKAEEGELAVALEEMRKLLAGA